MPDKQDNPFQGLINSWPALAALIIAAIGLIATKPSLESPRPTVAVPQPKRLTDGNSVPARLWQDPLTAVWGAQEGEEEQKYAKNFDILFSSLPAHSTAPKQPLLILFDCLPGDGNPETSEQRRRERYAVLSALNTAGYAPAPIYADRLLYARLPTKPGLDSSQRWIKSKGDKPSASPEIWIPFEWATAESQPTTKYRAVCVLWVGESYFPHHPLRSIIQLKAMIEQGARSKNTIVNFAIAGRLDSKPMHDLLDDDQTVAPVKPPPLEQVKLYVTRSTALFVRDLPPPEHSGLKVEYVIGTDDLLAEKLVEELELRGLHPGRPWEDIAIVAEWDSQYGREMADLFQNAVRKVRGLPDGADSRVASFTYLRGLDGKNAADKTGDTASTTPEPAPSVTPTGQAAPLSTSQEGEGQQQFDYVDRLARAMKSSGRRYRAIGVVGSDVYDKINLLQELRPTFPDALFFTTDLDARLLQRGEYAQTTRNLIIVSHYGLTLPESLQGKIAPFRSGYDTASYLACLRAVGYAPLDENNGDNKFVEVKKWCDVQQLGKSGANGEADVLLPKWPPGRQPRPSAHVFEVSRFGEYELTNDADDPLAGPSPRWRLDRLGWLFAALAVAVAIFFLISRPMQRLLTRRWRRPRKTDRNDTSDYKDPEESEFVPRRVLVGVAFVFGFAILLCLAIASHLSSDGEPLELLAGISVWPMMMLRFLAVGLCCYFIAQAAEELSKRNAEIRHDYHLTLPPPDAVGTWRRGWEGIKIWYKDFDPNDPDSNNLTKLWGEFLKDGAWSARLVRCGVLFFLSVLFCVFLAIWTRLDLSSLQAHARGPIAFWSSHVILLLTGVGLTALLIFVADSTLLCHRFITCLSRRAQTLEWPPKLLDAQASAFGLTQQQRTDPEMEEALKRGALLRFVDSSSNVVAHMIYYPFIVLLLLVIAQNRLFDDCPWNIPLVSIAVLCAVVALICSVYLQRSARKVRDDALEHLARAIQRRPAGDTPERAIQKRMQAEINGLNRGAFTSFYQNPIVVALLLPLGGGGGLAALSLLLGH